MFGLDSTVTGVTIVAFATSAPEMAVVILAAVEGDPDIATGSVVGSNIGNVLIVVGASAALRSFTIERRVLTFDVPAMAFASLAGWLLFAVGNVSRLDGLALLALLAVFLVSARRRPIDSASVGTSLPEISTSITAALRGHPEIAVRNAIGSNIFNLLFVLGLAGVVTGGGLDVADAVVRVDLPVMVAACVGFAFLAVVRRGFDAAGASF